MTDRIRTLADQALAMHKELTELAIKGAELTRDSQQRLARIWVDAVAPKRDEG